jgi:hypothetical protein
MIGKVMDLPLDGARLASDDLPELVVDNPRALARPLTIKARAYWETQRGDHDMPTRDAITPRGMREFLANVMLIEVREAKDGGSDYVVRLAGTKIEDVIGQMKGMNVRETLPAEIAARWTRILDQVVRTAEPVRATSRLAFKGMTWLAGEVFAAPLGENGKVSSVFAAADIWPVGQPPGANRNRA